MSTDTTQFNFVRGGDAAAEDSATMSGGKRIHYLGPSTGLDKAGDWVILRFITDQTHFGHVKQHLGVKTKNKPKGYPKDSKWPETMPATCRYDKVFNGYFPDCYVCDNPDEFPNKWGRVNKATTREWAVACLREEVVENGVIKGYRDIQREVPIFEDGKDTGKVRKEPALVMVNMAHSNFFSPLTSFYGTYKTVTDRDYKVEKAGEDKDTKYHFVPLDPIDTPEGRFAGPKFIRDDKGVVTQVADPHPAWNDRYLKAIEEQGYDINAIILERASDEYWAKFIDPNKAQPEHKSDSEGSDGGASAEEQAQAPDNEAETAEELKALRDRVRKGYSSDEAPAEGGEAAPAEDKTVDVTPAAASEAVY